MNINAASIKDFPPGTMISVEANGNDILLANVGGSYYAIGNVCTHMGCSLSEGTLNGNSVQCPCHSATFDLQTGKVLHGSASEPEPVYTVTIENDQILISL